MASWWAQLELPLVWPVTRTSSVADELMPMPCCSQSENLGIEASMLLNSSVALASTVTGEPRTALDCVAEVAQ